MAISRDIIASYRDPAPILRRRLGAGVREDRALAILMLACGLVFVAQWPRLAREAHLDPSVPLDARMGATLLAWLVIAPLLFYLVAAASHLALKPFGARGSWFAARLALFWALLAAAPLWLLAGLVAGFIGAGPALSLTGFAALAAFLWFWARGLWAVEFPGKSPP
jgi:hypothetical protein